jgi:hypothetical protein
MACEINASPSNGLVQSADGSGVIKLQSNGKTTNALAWVNFNGTGTVAIRSSYNVSSITDNGTGDYTLNFATALTDANYSTVGMTGGTGSSFVIRIPDTAAQTTTSQRVWTLSTASALQDQSYISVAVFGN